MGAGHHHGARGNAHEEAVDRPHCALSAADCAGPAGDLERRRKDRTGLLIALAVTACIFVAELVGGWLSGSLALRADAGHMFADVVALIIALAGIAIATRPVDSRRTWGYYRLEILSALANGVLLCVVAVVIVMEAWERFSAPPEIDLPVMIGVAILGLAANLATLALLRRNRGSMALRGAWLHALSDGISSVGVIAGGAVMFFVAGMTWIDPVLSVMIAVLIVYNAWGLVRDAVGVLLEGIPLGIEIEKVRSSLAALPGVKDVHDIHIWTITSGMFAFSCHLSVTGLAEAERDALLTQAKTLLHDRFAIDHSTIQVEGEAWAEIGLVH